MLWPGRRPPLTGHSRERVPAPSPVHVGSPLLRRGGPGLAGFFESASGNFFFIRHWLIRIRFPGRVASAIEIFSARVRLKISRAVLPAVACCCLARDLLMGVVQVYYPARGSLSPLSGWAHSFADQGGCAYGDAVNVGGFWRTGGAYVSTSNGYVRSGW